MLDRLFPLRHIKNIALFYLLTLVYNSWIIAGVWIFIWGAFMTKFQIGISDSITFAIGFLIELPSGVWADFIGRKKAIIIGNLLLTVGNLFVALSSSFLGITVWYLVWTIGYAFQSGATEAHAYDTLKKQGLSHHWDRVISTSVVIGKIAILVSTALGGYLFLLGFRLPYLALTLVSAIGLITALNLEHIPVKKPKNLWSIKNYLKQIKEGVGTLVKKHILPISITCLTTTGLAYMYNWGILRPLTAERFGYTPTTFSLLISFTSLVVIVFVWLLGKFQKKFHIEKIIFGTTFLYALFFTIMGFPHNIILGGLIMISLSIGLTFTEILFSQFINRHTPEKHRATTLSSVALFTKLPYVFLALVIGAIAEVDKLPHYTIAVGLIALALWALSLTKQMSHKNI